MKQIQPQLNSLLAEVDLVLLDMDGTLLDLRYDNEFWFHYLPRHYGQVIGRSTDEARNLILDHSNQIRGTLDFYCMEYWSARLGFDIAALNTELKELIQFLPGVPEFLRGWREQGKRLVLVTNSHPHGLDFKLAQTDLGQLLDAVYNAHDLGYPKEQQGFWTELAKVEPLLKRRSLLIDDNLQVLRSAQTFGVPYLLVSRRPDSQGGLIDTEEFKGIESFQQLGGTGE